MRRAREWHNSCEALWKEVQSLLQQWASSPDGPAAPLVDKAAVRIAACIDLVKDDRNQCFRRSWLGGRMFRLEHVQNRRRGGVLVVGGVIYMKDTAAAPANQKVQGCAGLPPEHQVCKRPRKLAVR